MPGILLRCICFLLITSLSHLNAFSQDKFPTGLDFDDDSYAKTPRKAKLTRGLEVVPNSASLKSYAPNPGNQGNYGTCAAWASAYCAKTIVEAIKNNWTQKEEITRHAFSPAFLFRLLKPDDNLCKGGAYLNTALLLLKEKGALPYNEISASCIPSVTESQLTTAFQSRINDYLTLFDVNATDQQKIQGVKKSISEKKPVIIGMLCPTSFNYCGEVWNPREEADWTKYGGHAMCIVGYDDEKFGGAVEVQNSWGKTWANEGYVWIRYQDFAKYTKYAFELVDLPQPKPEVADLSGALKFVLASGQEMPANLYVSSRGLTVVPAKPAAGPLTLYRIAEPYTSGTRFRIYISNNEPAFVYAFSTDLSNEITKIFPYEDNISAALTDKRNDVAIPDEDHFIEFDNRPGTDFLCVLYSREELNINDLIQKISIQQGSFSERIFKVIGDKLVDPKNIQFSKDKLAFKGFSKGKQVVAMMVELEHK
ncbi:DUF4384 domain-containing protein [Solitalea sp. MAHUQ-68]|uniref:DUF4384 domain-containing protein n=1 Tax=Solitalea agri TaxID=2953739 RepID=A0A9X2JDM4_9SPHI|nr:DUF4384 domain-containing protein [Solitalea agri]MCO4291521.1 DUF4384 domain-containing protein [Solitalea agri]